jgi:hypothetical protein
LPHHHCPTNSLPGRKWEIRTEVIIAVKVEGVRALEMIKEGANVTLISLWFREKNQSRFVIVDKQAFYVPGNDR